jgi:hypothetical protein
VLELWTLVLGLYKKVLRIWADDCPDNMSAENKNTGNKRAEIGSFNLNEIEYRNIKYRRIEYTIVAYCGIKIKYHLPILIEVMLGVFLIYLIDYLVIKI